MPRSGTESLVKATDGAHARMHRVLKANVTKPAAANAKRQQRVFNTCIRTYNAVRPHEALIALGRNRLGNARNIFLFVIAGNRWRWLHLWIVLRKRSDGLQPRHDAGRRDEEVSDHLPHHRSARQVGDRAEYSPDPRPTSIEIPSVKRRPASSHSCCC